MHALNEIFATIDGYIGGSNWFVYLLVGTGLFFTLYLKFPQIRYFRHAFRMVSGKYDEKGAKGDTSHFRALTTALSGTVSLDKPNVKASCELAWYTVKPYTESQAQEESL